MDAAQRGNEFITDLSAEGTRLHESQMMGIGRLSPAHQAGLLGDKPEMLLVAITPRFGNREDALVYPPRRVTFKCTKPISLCGGAWRCSNFRAQGSLGSVGLGEFRQPQLERLLNELGIGCSEPVLGSKSSPCPLGRTFIRSQPSDLAQ